MSCLTMFSVYVFFLEGQTAKVKPFPLMSLLPKHNMSQYYHYYGSLTTPPCSQAVVWTLYEVPIYISWSQVGVLTNSWYIWRGKKSRLLEKKRTSFKCYFLSSAGSVYLTDLLHRGGCRTGVTSAKQFQAHPSHLQSHSVCLQRCQTPQRDFRSAPQVSSVTASASDHFAGKLHPWTLAPC